MNIDQFCDREPAVVAAFHADAMTDDLLAHIEQCDACTESLLVASALRKELAAPTELPPPDAAIVWQRSLAFARKKAVAKATLPIRCAQISSVVITITAAVWLCLGSPDLSAWISQLGLQQLWISDRSFSNLLLTSILWGTIPSIALIGLSSWYLLRQE